MSTYLQSYRVGTLSVANGSTSVTGTTTLWLANVLAGDLIIVGNTLAEVASVESNTALTLVSGWTGTTVTGSAYVIHRWSRGWLQAGTTALLLADYVSRIPTFIPTTGAPSDAVGSPGNIAVDTSATVFYVKGATTWGSAVSMVGPAGELTRLDAVAGGDLAAWTGTNSAQIRKATAAEVRTAAGGIREVLAANRTYYVRADGSNSNNGLSNTAGGAFLTIQKAIDTVYALDLSIFKVTIQVGAGTYTGTINFGPFVGRGAITLRGDYTAPSNVNLAFTSGFGAFSVASGAVVDVGGFKISNSGAAGNGVVVQNGGVLNFVGAMEWGTCNARAAIEVAFGSVVVSSGVSHTISGNLAAFVSALSQASVFIQVGTVTLVGTPAITSFISCLSSSVQFSAITFAGTGATGTRYSVAENGVVKTGGGGASYFPGSIAGVASTGGQYL